MDCDVSAAQGTAHSCSAHHCSCAASSCWCRCGTQSSSGGPSPATRAHLAPSTASSCCCSLCWLLSKAALASSALRLKALQLQEQQLALGPPDGSQAAPRVLETSDLQPAFSGALLNQKRRGNVVLGHAWLHQHRQHFQHSTTVGQGVRGGQRNTLGSPPMYSNEEIAVKQSGAGALPWHGPPAQVDL